MADRQENKAQQQVNPFADAPSARKRLTLIGIYAALIANLMVSTTNATLLPAAALDIGGMDIYGLAQGISGILSVCAMPIYGFIGARDPSKKRLLCGGSLLVGAVVLFMRGISWSMMVIIIANVFWGLVSAGVFVIGYSMIRDMYDKKQAGLYLGLTGTMSSIGMLAGPFIGGLVIDQLGWRVFCFFLFACLAFAGIMVLFGVRVSREQAASFATGGGSMDYLGIIAVTLFLGGFILAISMGNSWIPFGSLLNNVLLVIAVVGLVILVVDIRKRGDGAIIPKGALGDRNTLVFSGINFLYNFGAMTLTFFVPGFVMTTLVGDPLVGFLGGALAGGLVLSIRAIPGLFLGPVFGKMIAKTGSAKGALMIGNALRIITMATLVVVLVPGTPVWIVYALMILAGIFTVQHSVTMSAGPQIQLAPNLRTTGNSVIQMGQNLGGSVGTAVFTLLISFNPVEGMHICLICALVAWIMLAAVSCLLEKAPEES